MKNKQLISIIVTGVVIIAVGVTGAVTNVVSSKMMAKSTNSMSKAFSDIINESGDELELPNKDYVAKLNVVGTIQGSSSTSLNVSDEYNHTFNMKYVNKLIKDKHNKGIYLYINSPGGTAYECDEFYLRLMKYKKKTGRPIYAYMGSEACSAAYYIAMAADKVYANRNSWVGNIGVYIEIINYKELYDKLGIKEIYIKSAKNKTMGAGGEELTKEQREIFQDMIDESYEQFLTVVSKGRNMSMEEARKLADGRIYTAKQSKENGLIDDISNAKKVKDMICEEAGMKETYVFEPKTKYSELVSSIFSKIEDIKPRSETEVALDFIEKNDKGVMMYYGKH